MKKICVPVLALCAAVGLVGGCKLVGVVGKSAAITELRTNWSPVAVGVDSAPAFSWQMVSKRTGAAQKAYRLRVFEAAAPDLPVWDSGVVAGSESIGVVYRGPALKPATRYAWEVAVQDENGAWLAAKRAVFSTGLLSAEGWAGSQWITPATAKNGIETAAFRKIIANQKPVASAQWFVSGLGVFEAYVNGKPVSNRCGATGKLYRDVLKPGFTHVLKCRHYFSYDITHLLKTEAGQSNCFSALVTRGWWRDQIVNPGKRTESGFRGMLVVRYEDGSEARFGTDTSWMAAYVGPVVNASIFDGEEYDARITADWMRGGQLTPVWAKARVTSDFAGELRPLQGPPVTVREDLVRLPAAISVYSGAEGSTDQQYGKVKTLRTYRDGDKIALNPGETLLVDFAQNASGWPSFAVSGKAGTQVTVRHAEMLNDQMGLKSRGNDGPEGSVYLRNLRNIFAGIKYTLSGQGEEFYRPQFSFFGFRYIAVTATAPVTFKKLRGEVVTSIPKSNEVGMLTTSNELVNRLFKNVFWGQYSNYLSVPTDCPQRNERCGWTADTQVFSTAAAYNANVYGFLSKWMADMRDSQDEEGAFRSVAPLGCYGNNTGVTGWADAGVIVPYNMYRMYGDKSILTDNYRAMCRYVDFIARHKGPPRQNYGDWLAYERNDGDIKIYLAACYWVWDCRMMTEIAQALGNSADVAKYGQMEKEAREFFTATYLNPDGTIKDKYRCQCAALFSLFLDLHVSDAAYLSTRQYLLDNIRRHGNRLQTGFLGTSILMETLTKIGCSDMAYALLLQRQNPSWLYSVDQGATTIWERWNSYTLERGFGDAGMNSFNHYAYGAVASWMYGTMAGIGYDFANPGFKNIRLAPTPDHRIENVSAVYGSPFGRISSAWRYDGDVWKFNAEIPANTTADVIMPVPAAKLTVNGKAPAELRLSKDGIKFLGDINGKATFKMVAGRVNAIAK